MRQEAVTMAENKLADLSMEFAVATLSFCDTLKGHKSLVNQLERSATSVGANIREAKYAHSKADFIAKLQIALKECYETEYWLELIQKAHLSDAEQINQLMHACGSIRRMLISSVNTTKSSIGKA
jgi:four helix bundle protein